MTTPRHCPSCGRTVDADIVPGVKTNWYRPAVKPLPAFLYCPVCGWCFGSDEQATA